MPEASESETTIPSRSISRRSWRRIGILISVLILVLGIHLHQRWSAVARLQYSLNRNYEIDFNEVQRPRSMPEFLDTLTLDVLKKMEDRGKLGPSNNRTALRTRVYTLFLGSIRSIEIFYPERVSRDFGPSLEQFDRIDYLLIDDPGFDSDTYLTGTTEILNSLAKLKRLKKLHLGCFHLEKVHLEQIAQLPGLEILLLEKVVLPADFVEILSQSATLSELHTDVSIPVSGGESTDPFAASPSPQDPFRSKSNQWKSSEAERQRLKEAGIKLIE